MKLWIFLIFLAVFSTSKSYADEQRMVVVELFTSPYCSDAPAADHVFQTVVRNEHSNVITISCAVTYLNPDRDVDSLLYHPCNKRQRAYRQVGHTSGATVPSVFINGTYETSGSRANIIQSGIKMAEKHSEIRPLSLSIEASQLTIDLSNIQTDSNLDIWLFGYHKTKAIAVESETQPRTIAYHHHTDLIENTGAWDGKTPQVILPLKNSELYAYAVLLQDPQTMRIHAAGKVERN